MQSGKPVAFMSVVQPKATLRAFRAAIGFLYNTSEEAVFTSFAMRKARRHPERPLP